MGKVSTIHSLRAIISTHDQPGAGDALCQDKITRLSIACAPDRDTFRSTPSKAFRFFNWQINKHDDTLKTLEQFAMHTPFILRVNIEKINIDTENNDPHKNPPNDLAATGTTGRSSQHGIVPCEYNGQLTGKHEASSKTGDNLHILPEMLRDGILVVNHEGMVRYANPAACKLFRRSSGQLIGYPFGYPMTDDDNDDVEITIPRPSGQVGIVEMRAVETVWNSESVLLISLHDVTEQKRLQRELQRLAIQDGLTGLYNHRFFYTRLKEELLRAHRYSHPLSLLMLDIDHFKQVNDNYGHRVGDTVLKGLGNLLMEQVRNLDRVCRYGGEEIMVIMPETESECAIEIAERIRNAIEKKAFDIDDEAGSVSITVSIGISCYPYHGKDASGLVAMADEALYSTKKSGRNRVSLAIPSDNAPMADW